jgi:hypothetical protein
MKRKGRNIKGTLINGFTLKQTRNNVNAIDMLFKNAFSDFTIEPSISENLLIKLRRNH